MPIILRLCQLNVLVIKHQVLEYREGNFKFCCKFHVKEKRMKTNATCYNSSPGLRLVENQSKEKYCVDRYSQRTFYNMCFIVK